MTEVPMDGRYEGKELMMLRPGVVEQIQEWKGRTFKASNLRNTTQPNYPSNFLGKNLKVLGQMNVVEQVEVGGQSARRYKVLGDFKLEEAYEAAEKIYQSRIAQSLEKMNGNPVEAYDQITTQGLIIPEDEDRLPVLRNQDYTAPTLELLQDLTLIDDERNIKSYKGDIELLQNYLEDWGDEIQILENSKKISDIKSEVEKYLT